MSGTKIKRIIQVHIITPDGEDHYPVFVAHKAAKKFINTMRSMQIPAEIV